MGDITTYTPKIQRIVRDYIANLYPTIMENITEMDKQLQTQGLPKDKQLRTLNGPVISNKIK